MISNDFCVYYRTGEKLELRHVLEGHQLGVVSVDMNLSGTCKPVSELRVLEKRI